MKLKLKRLEGGAMTEQEETLHKAKSDAHNAEVKIIRGGGYIRDMFVNNKRRRKPYTKQKVMRITRR
jgi:hypothetical protein